jgi:two-component system chemotaxis response regulator CheY
MKMTDIDIENLYEAENGHEALILLEEHQIDIIFTDINMPVMDGEKMVRIISADSNLNHIPIVVITSKGSDFTKHCFEELGVKKYLVKPFSPEQIIDIVEELMEG